MAEGNTPTVSSDGDSYTAMSEEETKINSEMAGAAGNAVAADDAALQRFLQQQRDELTFELRRIRHGDRPVTGQSHRDNIASFIAKHAPTDQAAGGKDFHVANLDPVEQHRPEAVLIEVQGVVEQRRVSSMLQSLNFRRHLENIIRGSLTTARQSSVARSRSQAASSPRPATPVVPLANRSRSPTEESVSSNGSASGDRVDALASQPVQADTVPQPAAARAAENVADLGAPAQRAGPQGERGLWDTISQVQHEEMVYEISDLLHRRLVSTTLASEFRSVMELHVQEHLTRTGANGEAVEDFVRNIQPSMPHVPNDFRHLGIIPGPHDDGSDSVSITGISATAVPYTQTNMHLSRELQSLKSQMEEMKNMMRLSFDLQLDIQRAIRQEVAAAVASATAEGATAAVASPRVQSAPVNDTHCLICLENHTDSVLYQCGHMCVCFMCGKNLMTRGNGKCPVCRAPIKDVIRAYKTNVE